MLFVFSALCVFLAVVKAQTVPINIELLSMFSLTRIDGNQRFPDENDLFAYVHAFALMERMNEFDVDTDGVFQYFPGRVGLFERDYKCNVNFNDRLVDTVSDFSVALSALADPTTDLFALDFVLGPSRSSTCVPVSFVTSTFSLPVFSPSCTSPELDDTLAHRFFARTIPSDDASALAIIELLKTLPTADRTPLLEDFSTTGTQVYDEVVVIYQEDTYGSNFKDALFEQTNEIDFIFLPFTVGNKASIDAAVATAAATGLNVFVGLFFADDIALVTEAALEQDLMNGDQLWIFSDGIISAEELEFGLSLGQDNQEEAVPENVLRAVNNTFLVQASGQVNEQIVAAFQEQAFTPEAGYVIRDIRDKLNEQLVIEGLDDILPFDFQEIEDRMIEHAANREQIELTDFSLFAFDMIVTIREFIETRSDNCEFPNGISGEDFIDFLNSDEAKFDGITGPVQFDASQSRDAEFAGFKLLNARFLNDPANVLVGEYDGTEWEYVDEEITFNSGLQTAPLKVNPPENVEQNFIAPAIRATIYTLAAIVLGLSIFTGAFVLKMSNRQVIRAAQPFFLILMIVGVIVSTLSIYMFPQEEQSGSEARLYCNAPFFLISLGLTISYGSLVFKMQRVVAVATTQPDLKTNTTDSPYKSLLYLCGLIGVEMTIFLITYLTAPLILEQRVVAVDDFGQPIETFDICSPEGNLSAGVYSLYFIFHLLFYAYGFRLILKEGRWIILSIVSQFQLYLLGIPVVVATGVDDPGVRFLVVGLLVLLSNFVLMILIFGPKFVRVWSGDDDVTWNTDKKVDTNMSNLLANTGHTEEGFESFRRSLVNTMKTDDFGAL